MPYELRNGQLVWIESTDHPVQKLLLQQKVKRKLNSGEQFITLRGKTYVAKNKNEQVLADNRSSYQKKQDTKTAVAKHKQYQSQKNQEAGEQVLGALTKVVRPSTYIGPVINNNDKSYIENVFSGEGTGNDTANLLIDTTSPFALKGLSTVINASTNLGKTAIVNAALRKNINNWKPNLGYSSEKRIDLTPKTHVDNIGEYIPTSTIKQNKFIGGGMESDTYDRGSDVLKVTSREMYIPKDLKSSNQILNRANEILKRKNSLPSDVAEPIEYMGYTRVPESKTFAPVFRQKKLLPLDDKKTYFMQPMDRLQVQKEVGVPLDNMRVKIGDNIVYDVDTYNSGVDSYGRIKLYDFN